jgi:hypothetical protein
MNRPINFIWQIQLDKFNTEGKISMNSTTTTCAQGSTATRLFASITLVLGITLGGVAFAQKPAANPLIGIWDAQSCERQGPPPSEIEVLTTSNPCLQIKAPDGEMARLNFRPQYVEFNGGRVQPITYLVDEQTVVTKSDGAFSGQRLTIAQDGRSMELRYSWISQKALITYRRSSGGSLPASTASAESSAAISATQTNTQSGLDGNFVGLCMSQKVQGASVSMQTLLQISDGGTRSQQSDVFFASGDCTGSVYASVVYPEVLATMGAMRNVKTPDGKSSVMARASNQTAATGNKKASGAFMITPQEPDKIQVIFNNQVLRSFPISYSEPNSKIIYGLVNDKLYAASSVIPGTKLDAEGFPVQLNGKFVFTRK